MSVRVRAVGVGLGAVVLGIVSCLAGVPAVADEGGTPEGFTLQDPRISESSGLAASRAHKDVYWTHNDSDDGPYVYAIDGRTGKTVATVTLRGIDPRDVEAISVGPDGDVYVGDIGDNLGGTWPEVWIYRFPEPRKLRDTTVTPTRYTVRYEGGPRDAESLMVHPKTGRVYIASKNDEGKAALYAAPSRLTTSGINTFSRVAKIGFEATDGAFSPDGKWLVLRAYFAATAYRWKDGVPVRSGNVSVPIQRQGESVTFTRDGRTLMFGSEGRGSSVEPVEMPGSGSSGGEGDASTGGSSQGDMPDQRQLVLGGVTFLAAVALWLGLRRAFRRRR